MKKEVILKQEIERLSGLLPGVDPTTEAYSILLCNIDKLGWMLADTNYKPTTILDPTEVKIEPVSTGAESLAEPVPAPVVEDKKIFTPELLAYDEVREICNKAMSRGVNVKEIIAKYVPTGERAKLTLVPQERYPELIEEVNNAQ